MPNVDSIWLKTKELLTYHYNIATKYVTNVCCPKEALCQI